MSKGIPRRIPELTAAQIEQFWEQVDMSGDCWTWMGRLNRPGGYGVISINGKDYVAHRISWEIHHGPIPAGFRGLHDCDNPQCVRPDHVFLGTVGDNNQDKARKGRARNGYQSGRRDPNQRKATAHLCDAQLVEIVGLYLGGMSQPAIAQRFGCAQTTVSNIVTLRTQRVQRALAAAAASISDYEDAA